MELSILYAIPRTAALDSFFLAVTKIAGSYGQLWVIIAAVLLVFKKTRKAGVAVLLAYAAVFLIVQFGLKNLISRPRPCQVDLDFVLLVDRPSSSSFPSTHSAWACCGTDRFQPHVSVSAFPHGRAGRHCAGNRTGSTREPDHRTYMESRRQAQQSGQRVNLMMPVYGRTNRNPEKVLSRKSNGGL